VGGGDAIKLPAIETNEEKQRKEEAMSVKPLDRREFLKLALASAAAAGLSHFRILNVGGPGVAYAGQCGAEPQDVCNPPSAPDDCTVPTTDPDECKLLGGFDEDMCSGQPGDPDLACNPPTAADACNPPGDLDLCDTLVNEPDTCLPPDDLDSCTPGDSDDPDECNPPTGNLDYACDPVGGDICDPPAGDPDWCDPWVGWVDECTAPGDTDYQCSDPLSEPDFCTAGDPDLCEPAFEPDECQPEPDDMDLPTAVEVASFQGRSGADPAALTLPALGLAAALGGAAIARRRRGQSPEPEEPPA
jgi:hypothetical protein